MKTAYVLLTVLLAVLLCAGCGGKSARAVAEEYIGYMKGGDFDRASLLWDYDTDARQQNPDWDSIAQSQRKLIIGKLAQEKASSLKMWGSYFSPETKIMELNETGDSARAVLEGGRISSLDLTKVGENWRISAMGQ